MGGTTNTPIRSDLSETQQRLKGSIVCARTDVRNAETELFKLTSKCEHVYIQTHDSAVCDICGHDAGWWCPESPDGLCDYTQADGSYNEDQCRHCGQPDERK